MKDTRGKQVVEVSTPSLNIIGAGAVGKTLGKLFSVQKILAIKQILNSSLESSLAAQAYIGAGQVTSNFKELTNANVYLLSVPDDALENVTQELAKLNILNPLDIIFCTSGSFSSLDLKKLLRNDVHVASIHPVTSFAEAEIAYQNFSGTYCGVEGDKEALEVLIPIFEKIGAKMFSIDPAKKLKYHVANIFASNYLVTLFDQAARLYADCGVAKAQSRKILSSLSKQTIANLENLSPEHALTGPIARGDVALISKHLSELSTQNPDNPDTALFYKELGKYTLKLARKRDSLGKEKYAKLEDLLN